MHAWLLARHRAGPAARLGPIAALGLGAGCLWAPPPPALGDGGPAGDDARAASRDRAAGVARRAAGAVRRTAPTPRVLG